METFKRHLDKAEACRCQLRKYKVAQAAVAKCLEHIEDDEQDRETNQTIAQEEIKVDELQGLEEIHPEKTNQKVEEETEDVCLVDNDDSKENEPSKTKLKRVKLSKLKPRINALKFWKLNSNIDSSRSRKNKEKRKKKTELNENPNQSKSLEKLKFD